MNALELDNFKWLENVPINGIIKIREEGELQNMREILSKEINSLTFSKDEDFVDIAKNVNYNLDLAFKRHNAQINQLDREFRKKYQFDAGTLIVTGSMIVTCAFFPPLSILAAIIGGGDMVKILRDTTEERLKREELRRRPIALLFEAYNVRQKAEVGNKSRKI